MDATACLGLLGALGLLIGMAAIAAGCILEICNRRINLAICLMRNGATTVLGTFLVVGVVGAALEVEGLTWSGAAAFVSFIAVCEIVAFVLRRRRSAK